MLDSALGRAGETFPMQLTRSIRPKNHTHHCHSNLEDRCWTGGRSPRPMSTRGASTYLRAAPKAQWERPETNQAAAV